MKRSIKTFKSPSKIQFDVTELDLQKPMLSQAQRGETFLRGGSVCLRVDASVDASVDSHKLWICNLQTGRVWASEDCEIEWVQVRMHIAGEGGD